jgi:hypothetical protein
MLGHLRALHTELASWDAVMRGGMKRKQEQIRKLEAAASEIRLFQPAMIPGLAQTADYARRVFKEVSKARGASDVEAAVAARIERQKILLDDTKQFHFLVTEGALRWAFASPATMAAQLEHMASLSRFANIDLAVIPVMTPVPTVAQNPFVISDGTSVRVETLANELVLRDAKDVAVYAETFERLRSCAVDGDAARSLLADVAADYRRLAR